MTDWNKQQVNTSQWVSSFFGKMVVMKEDFLHRIGTITLCITYKNVANIVYQSYKKKILK